MLVKNPQTGKIEIVPSPRETFFYNTGKVRIGILYQRPPPAMSRDERIIQRSLLPKPRRSLWNFL
jgi:hypothetical protein